MIKTLAALGFSPLNQFDEPGKEVRFFKPYDAIGRLIVFDLLSGQLFAFDLGSEENIVRFTSGDLVIKDRKEGLPTLYLSDILRTDPVDLCALINVNRVVMIAELKDAVSVFERIVELQLKGSSFPFMIGDRVIYSAGSVEEIGQIEAIDDSISPNKYHIRTASGRIIFTSLVGNMKKAPTDRRAFDFYHNLKPVK